jgi:hypothetical protein
MTNQATKATRPVRVVWLNCFDAKLFSAEVPMSPAEEARLSALLGWLQDAGVLLRPAPAAEHSGTFADVIAHLRDTFGAPLVEAGLGAEPLRVPPSSGAPVAIMPIWPFEPEGEDPEDPDVLLRSGRLWGADVMIDALRVGGPDDPAPVLAVRPRLDRWGRAGGGGRLRAAVRPPGRPDWYVLGAISAPA